MSVGAGARSDKLLSSPLHFFGQNFLEQNKNMHHLSAGGKIMETKLNEELKVLSELIRKADELINPEESLAYLVHKDMRDRLYGMKPACFMKLQPIGRDTSAYLFPICNRHGMEDPKVINLSIKMLQKIMTDSAGRFDNNDIQKMLSKLQHRHDTFVKQIPKPASQAARKAHVSKMFNNIRKYLTLSKTGETA